MRVAAAAFCLSLAACGPGADDPGPGAVTVGEAKALDDAAAMLDARRPPAEAATVAPAPPPPTPPTTPSAKP
ncbi:hypothetical protein [Novosphingobium sp. Gsoil 351]|uniref:hypothetical protein n=1 Tax=Novosphingobium sp. Gsoil 351 TaxID=2675225 RepID=UPI0012B4BD36|nr:hypothetical protein [Novosphingobium sp. Gsoil 351]QGN54555.1 hypothetical protein GKE62_08295 [Novosphingobium sp. Gsoil 351]